MATTGVDVKVASTRGFRWTCRTHVVKGPSRFSVSLRWQESGPMPAPLFLVLRSTTRERPIALPPTLITWWERLRDLGVVEWKGWHGVACDACSKVSRWCVTWECFLRVCGWCRERRLGIALGNKVGGLKEHQNSQGVTLLVVDLAKVCA